MNKKIIYPTSAIFSLCTIFFAGATLLSAQNTSPADQAQGTPQKATIVATVNLQNASILMQKDNLIYVGFDISNKEGIQPQVIYAVNLLKKESDGQYSLADKLIYNNDALSLGANQTIHKEFDYQAPAFLKGTYKIGLEARNSDGLPFSVTQINNEITLNGSGEYVVVDSDGCFLTVEGEPGNKKYTPEQGVDVASEENLILHCPIKSSFKKTVSVTPTIQTRYRTAFGKILGGENLTSITLAPGKNTEYSTKISKKSLEPQAYEIWFSFINDKGELISQPVFFHYVLRGVSATIQNMNLDKDYYSKGDIAGISLYWTGSADSFPGARGPATQLSERNLSVDISNDKEKPCIARFTKKITNKTGGLEKIGIPITSDCKNPAVSITMTDQDGKIIAQKYYSIKSASPDSKTDKILLTLFLTAFIFALGLISYVLMKKDKGIVLAIIGLIAFLGFFTGGQPVKADTISWMEGGGCTFLDSNLISWTDEGYFFYNGDAYYPGSNVFQDTDIYGNFLSNRWQVCAHVPIPVSYSTGLDKTSYSANETVTASGVGWIGGCSNMTPETSLYATVNGTNKVLSTGGGSISGVNYYSAPSSSGSYNATFTYNVGHIWYDTYTHNIPYTVTASVPSAPSNISGSCPSPGTSATVSWSPVAGATFYNFRADDQTHGGWNGSCNPANGTGDYCADNVTQTSLTGPTIAGSNYNTWVQACNSAGCSSAVSTTFTCAAPPAPPPSCTSSGPSGTPTIPFNQGTYDVYAYGVQNATTVTFPTWSDVNGQDDIVWYQGVNQGNGTWKATVNMSNHSGDGPYSVHIYTNGSSSVFCGTANFVRAASFVPFTPWITQSSASTMPGTQFTIDWGVGGNTRDTPLTPASTPVSCTISCASSAGDPNCSFISSGAKSGSRSLTLNEPGTYVITDVCTSQGQTMTSTVTHNVNGCELTASPANTSSPGNQSVLSWKTNSVGAAGNSTVLFRIDPDVGSISVPKGSTANGTVTVYPPVTTTYTGTYFDNAGGFSPLPSPYLCTVTVTVPSQQTPVTRCTITPQVTDISPGGSATLSFTTDSRNYTVMNSAKLHFSITNSSGVSVYRNDNLTPGSVTNGTVTVSPSATEYYRGYWWDDCAGFGPCPSGYQCPQDSTGMVSPVTVNVASSPTSTVTSPNGGEIWKKGTLHAVNFALSNWINQANANHIIAFQLYKGGVFISNSGASQITIGPNGASGGGISWTIPASLSDGTDYTVRIIDYAPNGSTVISQDWSDQPFTINSAVTNSSPNAPTITGPATGNPSVNYTYTFTSTDPENNTLKYEIDWDNNGTIEQTLPATGYVNSGTSQSQANNWSGTGTKTFRARAVDVSGAASAWTTYNVNITIPPATNSAPSAPTVTGPSSGNPDTSYTFTIRSTDPESDQVRYEIDWDMNGTQDELVPASGYTTSGTSLTASHSWTGTGTKTFQVRARDNNATPAVSGWTGKTISLASQCADTIDNEGDGYADINDPDCHTDGNWSNVASYDPSRNETGGIASSCNDHVNNNSSGLIDCADPVCHINNNLSQACDITRSEGGHAFTAVLRAERNGRDVSNKLIPAGATFDLVWNTTGTPTGCTLKNQRNANIINNTASAHYGNRNNIENIAANRYTVTEGIRENTTFTLGCTVNTAIKATVNVRSGTVRAF